VTRRAFRSPVEAPRPLGALIMVSAASATLAVTGQIAPWALAAQGAALVAAFALREQPRSWQRSAPVLNTGLVAIAGIAFSLWLQGKLAVVALAHFALLAQGLQLLDARPRRSEFLLVALALFQVVLASNLTDSILFPALLIVFLLATVWTLLVHTLRAEALEAGDPLAASHVATPGLLRTTLVASTASVLLALVLFVVLPRMRAAVVPGGGLGMETPTAGFSDEVQLGELGRIRSDPRTVLRVETLEGEPAAEGQGYWRGLAFDRFDGKRWSVTPSGRIRIPGNAEWGIALSAREGRKERSRRPDRVQRIVREPVASGVIFYAGRPERIAGPLEQLERDRNGGVYAPRRSNERVSYTAATRSAEVDRTALRDDRVAVPPGPPGRYLQLPKGLSPRVKALAAEITQGATDDAKRAERLEAYLLANGRYSDTPPRIDPDDPRSPVEVFLEGGLAGHCEYFATSMVLLARAVGLPTRLVNGFAGGRANRVGDFVTLARSDAHTWVEVHFAEAGWVRYDPTPPDLRLRGAAGGPLSLADVLEAMELWWFQQVVEFDRSTQGRALRSAWLAWRRWRSSPSPGAAAPASGAPAEGTQSPVDPRPLVLAALALAGAGLLARARWSGRRRDRVPAPYARALRLLARRGLVRDPAQAARPFAAQVAGALPAAGAAAFARLTEAYLAARFGGRPMAGDGLEEDLRKLEESLRAARA